jgi:hypothetical protein
MTQLCPLMTSIFSKGINLEQAKRESFAYLLDDRSSSASLVEAEAEPRRSEASKAEVDLQTEANFTSMARTSAAILTEVSPLRFVAEGRLGPCLGWAEG